MGLNDAVTAERAHISFFGVRNAGKSSVVNAFTGQKLALVSDIKGTTTDPVKKSMELLPLGPVVIIDTPGIDDEGELGSMRVERSLRVLSYTDIAILVVDASIGISDYDRMLINEFKDKKLPYIIAYNKCELINEIPEAVENEIYISAAENINIDKLKEVTARLIKNNTPEKQLLSDLICKGDIVVLVVPIDSAAPKGRLILPQQQTIRAILDCNAMAVVVQEDELSEALENLHKKPRLVITDSQAFGKVSRLVPEDIEMTSFSILFARYKGNLDTLIQGVRALDKLKAGDKVLIAEGCTHHRQCDDIGTVKLPAWIKKYKGEDICFEFSSGMEYPDDLSLYSIIIHCGACMLNEREMKHRLECAVNANVPITNYGMVIAAVHGILERSIKPFIRE